MGHSFLMSFYLTGSVLETETNSVELIEIPP